MRLNDADKQALAGLAALLKRSQTDTIRILVREGRKILPELRTLAKDHPPIRSAGQSQMTQIIK